MATRCPCCEPVGHTTLSQLLVPVSGRCPLLPTQVPQPPSHPRIQRFEHRRCLAKAEGAFPPLQVDTQLLQYPPRTCPRCSPCQPSEPPPEAGHRLGIDPS